jgi:hypothetical protein
MTNQQNSKKNMYNKLLIFFADPHNVAGWTAFTHSGASLKQRL